MTDFSISETVKEKCITPIIIERRQFQPRDKDSNVAATRVVIWMRNRITEHLLGLANAQCGG